MSSLRDLARAVVDLDMTKEERWLNPEIAQAVGIEAAPQCGAYDFIGSVDDAMLLVPEDAIWRIGPDTPCPNPEWFRANAMAFKPDVGTLKGEAIAAHPAQALTAACLRLRDRLARS